MTVIDVDDIADRFSALGSQLRRDPRMPARSAADIARRLEAIRLEIAGHLALRIDDPTARHDPRLYRMLR